MSPRGAADRIDDERLQLAVFAGEGVEIHPLPAEGRVTMGRGAGNDVVIEHPSVSRNHAVLRVGADVTIEDLGSHNGTFVRSARLSSPASVGVGEPVTLGAVRVALRRVRGVTGVANHTATLRGDAPTHDVVVASNVLRAVYDDARRVAGTSMSVLLLGETGVGKDVLARVIHAASSRAQGPFVPLNCAALTEALLESELFGHEKGAFTGATDAKLGLFEAAANGTIFLDEVGELPAGIQSKLLRVLEDHNVLRVGGRAARPIDVRFISATNRDIEAEVERGTFRRDLYFRLNAVTLSIPPLRERLSEIGGLSQHFLALARGARGRPSSIAPEALALLERYAWPGNIRELRNVIERAAIFCDGDVVGPEHLPAKLRLPTESAERPKIVVEPAASSRPTPFLGSGSSAAEDTLGTEAGRESVPALRSDVEELERRRIVDALDRCKGNQTQAAALLGMSRRSLVTKLSVFNLPRPRKVGPTGEAD